MSDCISRSGLVKKAMHYEIAGFKTAKVVLLKDVLEAPAFTERPATQGHWIFDCERVGPDGFLYSQYHCSECGGQRAGKARFCEFCGAGMGGERHG